MFRRRSLVHLSASLGAAGLLLAVTACDGSSSGSASGGGTVKFGVITAVGSSLTNYPDVQVGASAAVDAINKAGGVNGKKVELFFCNTRGEVNQAMACARQADKEGVAAIIGRVDVYSAQTLKLLEAAKIPDIGNVSTGADIDYQSAYTYPLQAGNFGAYTALPSAFKADGAKKMVVASIDLPIGIRQGQFAEQVGQSLGLQIAPMIKVPSQGITDYAPYVQQIKDSNADAAIVELGPAGFQAFVKAAGAVGLRARLSGTAFTFGQSEAQGVGPLADRLLVTAPYPSTDDRQVPGIARYNQELDASGASADLSLRRLGGLNAWLSMHAAAEVAKTITGDVTRESMNDALHKARGIDLYGLVTYSPANLGTDLKADAFARFPKSDYHVLTFKSNAMVDAGQKPIPDPLGPVR
jgi:ABC-type branched-subunit amino acid transport system substrate-binding protein